VTKIQAVQQSPLTTVIGGIFSLGGILLTLVPSDVRSACVDSISSSENPALMGGLVVIGIVMSLIGPSLGKKPA
jgi:hypothetical protein